MPARRRTWSKRALAQAWFGACLPLCSEYRQCFVLNLTMRLSPRAFGAQHARVRSFYPQARARGYALPRTHAARLSMQAGLVVCKNPRTEFRFPDQKTVPKTGSENGPDFGTGAPAAHSRYAILTLRVKNAVRAYLYRSGSQAPVSWFCSRTNVFQLRCHRPQINC